MALVLAFIRNRHESFRVLRYRNGFRILDSVRCGYWLARK
jgi:hypothetical protein